MAETIRIRIGEVEVLVELNDTECARRIARNLPITARANRWGDEVYFDIPVDCPPSEDARAEMEVGEAAYWPPGSALCLFFGPTPVSGPDGKPRAASPVNPVGRILGDPSVLKEVRDGDAISIDRAE